MKQLTIVTTRHEIGKMYAEEVTAIFKGYLKIDHYSLKKDFMDLSKRYLLTTADIILITAPDNFALIRSFVQKECPIIDLEYTYCLESVQALHNYPEDTKALICMVSPEVSRKTASMLYEAGLKNLILQVYTPDRSPKETGYDLAIVSEHSSIVPDGIKNIFSLGRRKIALPTLTMLAISSGVLDDHIENRILYYCESLIKVDNFVLHLYDNSTQHKIQFETIMNCIDYAIMLLSDSGRILDANPRFYSLFNIQQKIDGIPISTIHQLQPILPFFASSEEKSDKVIHNLGRTLLLSKVKLPQTGKSAAVYLLLIKDMTDIKKLETTLHKQLSSKGHLTKYQFSDILGESPRIKDAIQKAQIIAQIDRPTLILGESGTGKELFAQSIHNASSRKKFPFIAINCATLPANLLESELFGYADGSFTGAKKGGYTGLFEKANYGTLFLDEIGEISLETQTKLLRVLEEKEIMRLGSGEIISVNVRILAATNKNLRQLVKAQKFRLDLYYRLNTLIVQIPALRQRPDDILLLSRQFLQNAGFPEAILDDDLQDFFRHFPWEGNVRELRNCVEFMAYIAKGPLKLCHLPDYILEESAEQQCPAAVEAFSGQSQSDRQILFAILTALKAAPLGRRKLASLLQSKFTNLSEYHLRRLTTFLQEKKLLELGKGRTGMRLTAHGAQLIPESQ